MTPSTRADTRPEVVVAVGTDHHPFDRLVAWVDEWAEHHQGVLVLVQRGTSAPTEHCLSAELLPHGDLLQHFAESTVVVSHGGPSTVMDARMVGRLPVVVARDPDRGEHVDDHQQRFTQHLRRHDLARVADDMASLHRVLDEAMDHPERFAVALDDLAVRGVTEFANQIDGLLGTSTPVGAGGPSTPVGAVGPSTPVGAVGPSTPVGAVGPSTPVDSTGREAGPSPAAEREQV